MPETSLFYVSLAIVFGILGVVWALAGLEYMTRVRQGHPERSPYCGLFLLVYIAGTLTVMALMFAALEAASEGPSVFSFSALAPQIVQPLVGIFVASVQIGIVIAVVRYLWCQLRRLLTSL